MNKKTIKSLTMLLAAGLVITFTACKKKTETTTPAVVTPAKTLDKATLTNKTWYNKGSSIVHSFKTNGDYGVGKWRWVNNSDTMEIDILGDGAYVKWKFNWNTDTEMECEWIGNGGARLFKDKAW